MKLKHLLLGAFLSFLPGTHKESNSKHHLDIGSILTHSSYQGINGVQKVDSGNPGPKVVISACTHGGETAGLQVIQYLLHNYGIREKIRRGEIYFVLSNMDAYNFYLKSGDFKKARYIDQNMNRCATKENILNSSSSEARRIRELHALLSSCDIHIDLHSTTMSSSSIAILTDRSQKELGSLINVQEQYINLTTYQTGKPLIDICERSGGIGIGIETGLQLDETAFKNGVDNIIRILSQKSMLPKGDADNELEDKSNIQYTIIGSILVEDSNAFQLTKTFKHGEFVAKGSSIAEEKERKYYAPQDCYILLPTSKLYPSEEYCFLGIKKDSAVSGRSKKQ